MVGSLLISVKNFLCFYDVTIIIQAAPCLRSAILYLLQDMVIRRGCNEIPGLQKKKLGLTGSRQGSRQCTAVARPASDAAWVSSMLLLQQDEREAAPDAGRQNEGEELDGVCLCGGPCTGVRWRGRTTPGAACLHPPRSGTFCRCCRRSCLYPPEDPLQAM